MSVCVCEEQYGMASHRMVSHRIVVDYRHDPATRSRRVRLDKGGG